MKKALSFNDVLVVPGFTDMPSRKEELGGPCLDVTFMGEKLKLPILSAPMDTVTNAKLAIELHKAGGLACLHRFQPIGDNVKELKDVTDTSGRSPIVSVGLQDDERLEALVRAGANKVLLDVAHGGMQSVADWIFKTSSKYPELYLMVGNFATNNQIDMVIYNSNSEELHRKGRLALRVGVGGGSACTTRIKTGCGMPTLASLLDIGNKDYENKNVVGDGGFKTPGDIVKGLAAGASVVMLGSMLAGTEESPGELIQELGQYEKGTGFHQTTGRFMKKFRGSAATSSYKDQGKEWATAEGEEFLIPYKGSLKSVLSEIEGGLRSGMTYVGANNLTELQNNATFVEITNNGWLESQAHGKK